MRTVSLSGKPHSLVTELALLTWSRAVWKRRRHLGSSALLLVLRACLCSGCPWEGYKGTVSHSFGSRVALTQPVLPRSLPRSLYLPIGEGMGADTPNAGVQLLLLPWEGLGPAPAAPNSIFSSQYSFQYVETECWLAVRYM